MQLTLEQLKQIMPRMVKNPKTAAKLLPHLQAAMDEAQINTRERMAAFLAQIAHESGELKYMEELWGPTKQQLRYEGTDLAKRLGNTQEGDGYKFRGRGPIQLTGRANYRDCGKALGLDLEADPDAVATWAVGFRTTCWFWTKNKLNELADKSDFDAVTRRINGGFNGKEHRDAYYKKALEVLK